MRELLLAKARVRVWEKAAKTVKITKIMKRLLSHNELLDLGIRRYWWPQKPALPCSQTCSINSICRSPWSSLSFDRIFWTMLFLISKVIGNSLNCFHRENRCPLQQHFHDTIVTSALSWLIISCRFIYLLSPSM